MLRNSSGLMEAHRRPMRTSALRGSLRAPLCAQVKGTFFCTYPMTEPEQ